MRSSPNIYKAVELEGTVFCSPQGALETEKAAEEAKTEDLRALETFWRKKGYDEGFATGEAEGLERGQRLGALEGERRGHMRGLQEGGEQGKAAGYEEGYAKRSAELEGSFALLKSLQNALEEQTVRLVDEARPELVKLCVLICEKVLRRDLATEASFVKLLETLLSHARSIGKKEELTVYLNAADFALVERHAANFVDVNFLVDPSVKPQAVRIAAALGVLNFDINRLLGEIEQAALARPES